MVSISVVQYIRITQTEHNLRLNVIGWVIGLRPPLAHRVFAILFSVSKIFTNCGPKPLIVRELVSSSSTTLIVNYLS